MKVSNHILSAPSQPLVDQQPMGRKKPMGAGEGYLTLLDIYRKHGLEVRVGLSPRHFNNILSAPYAYLHRDGRPLSTGGGIAIQEIYFLETLLARFSPRSIFIIGNAFGWSTVLLALLAPQAKVLALDAGVEGTDNQAGIRLTNVIAAEEELSIVVEYGTSPIDVPRVVTAHFDSEPIELVLIDGLHTIPQQQADFDAVRPYSGSHTIFLFHDVIDHRLLPGFERIAAQASDHNSRILYRTPSGMGILWPKSMKGTEVERCINAFSESDQALRLFAMESLQAMFPALAVITKPPSP